MFKKTLAWLLTLALFICAMPLSVFAADTTVVDGLSFDVVDGSAQLTDGKSAVGDVVIPETVTIEGTEYAVTNIAGNAFNDANEVTSVVVPNSVTALGGAAFANMDKLKSITIGNGVTSWGSKLAVNNYELETVVIAEGATLIGDLAFRTCPKLANVTLPSTLKSIGATAFAYAAITELNIPASVESIGSDSFKDIDTLKKVTFLGENTKLGSTSFQMCDGLEEVVLPAKLTVIPQGAFRYCTSLKTVNFPESLTEIGNYSFQGCTSLETVTISKNITKLVTNAFNGCTSLKNLTIEEGFCGTIGGYVFQGCTALESVVIPSSMETVGESMFNMCSNLKNVTLSEGVKTLNISAFANCTSLVTLVLPDSLERIRHGSFANCTALKTLVVLGENLPIIEHSNALDGLSDDLVVLYSGDDAFTGNWAALADKAVAADENDVALVGKVGYDTLADAIAAANAIDGGATVELLADVILSEKQTISGNVTISGDRTITRDDAYTGTLFTVNAGATLTLDGGLTIDGGNAWTLNEELYNKALNLEVSGVTWAELITSEENAPNATAPMFKVTGSVVANDVTIQNNYSDESSNNGDYGVFQVDANATLTMTGAIVKHIVTGGANSVAHLSTDSVWTINDGTLITDTFAAKNGGVCRNDSGKLVMNGGEISNNKALNTNGTFVMLYKGSMEMNGGKICSNSGIFGANNGRCAPIYGHSTSTFIMTDGEICHNTGISYGGVDVPSSIKVEISGGYIGKNVSALGNANADVNGNANTAITGGTFTQDVSAWLAPNTGLVYDETTGTYGVVSEKLYKLHLTDPATGEPASIPYLEGGDLASLVAYGKPFYANYYNMELEILYDVKVDETVVIDYPMTINLNGHTITGANVYPVIRVQGGADVTVKGGSIVNDDYVFVLGASDGSSAGNLTIESGSYKGDTTVASVTKGTLTINGGTFEAVDTGYGYDYTLNCIDANYKDGSAKIEVNGGTFYKFNPANNAAEGTGTSFVTSEYLSEADGDYYTVRVNKDALTPIVTITFKDGGNETTLKYPSERFDSIQKLIGTNSYADFVLGATQSELLAYIADGRATDIVITLHDDVALDAPINFYNKYFQISVGYDITLDGNGHTITWADGYNGTLFNVESGVNLTVEDLTIDGDNAFTFYNDTTTVENGQNWYTRFVNVGEKDKPINANVIVNAGALTLDGVTIWNVTIASDGANGKTENSGTSYILKYNDDLALIKSNGGKVNMNDSTISDNAGMVLNAVKSETSISNTVITGNLGCGNKSGIIVADGGKMVIDGAKINGNKAMARSATVLGVINGAEVTFNAEMNGNKHIGVGSNTAGSIVCLEGASQFVMNGGSISNNVGGRAGAIASRWVGGNYGQHAETSIVLNAGEISGNTASNDSWNGASIFLRSPATIGAGMKVEGTIAVNAAPGELDITGGTFTNFNLIVTNGLSAEITGGTFDTDPAEWLAEGYVAPKNADGKYSVTEKADPVVIVNTVPYASWEEAMVANDTSAGNSKFDVKNATIVLLADISYDAEFEHAFTGNTVINLNGHNFYAMRTVTMSDTAQIIGEGTFDVGADGWPLVIRGNVHLAPTVDFNGTVQFYAGVKGNLWIGNENALGTEGKYNTADSDAFVRIIFREGLEVLDFQYGHVTLTKDDTTLDNQKITIGANATFTVAEGVTLGLNPSTKLTLNGKVDGDGTVMVSSFEHLKQVITETEVKNVKLGAHVSGIMTIRLSTAAQVTVDLNGYTWSSSDVALNVFRAGTEVTLKNGTIKGNSTGGTVHVTYNGKLILGENLTVLSGGHANAIKMDNGVLEVAENANPQVIGGISSLTTADETANKIYIASGLYDGPFTINENSVCVLTGGTFTQDVDQYCADDYMTKITTKDSNCYWTVVKAEPLFAIHGANMNLGNALDMNFFIDPVAVDNTLADEKEDKNHTAIVNAMNQKVKNWSVVITRIEKGGIAYTKTYTSDDWWYNKGAALMYVIYEDIAARNMTDTIYVQVFDANGTPVTAIWEDSVYNYANRIMKSTYDDAQNGDAKAVKRMTLMVDMLNYGAAAQKQFGYRLDALASDINANYASYATSNYESLDSEQSIQPEDSTLYSDLYVGVSLGLTSDLKMGFAFDKSIMDLVNNHNHSITVTHTDYHGKEHKTEYTSGYEFGTIESNDDIALVYYEEILVGDCNQIVTVTVTNDKGVEVLTIKDSVYYYVDRMGERVLPCGIPLLKFSQSARAYLGKAN